MNYYEHHIGDYDEATAHLTACEDGIYSRLIRKYMATEKALPSDVKALQRLVRARSRDEKEAVQTILDEFFELHEDGFHQKRCDETIARYQDKQRKARASAEARWGAQRSQSDGNANASADAMRTHSDGNANQSPITNHQTPIDKTKGTVIATATPSRELGDDGNPVIPKDAGEWARYFREKHGVELNASSVHDRRKAWPLFTAWAAANVSTSQMDAAVAKARAESKGAIAFLPAYADRVLATMSAPSQQRMSADEQRRAISDANGNAWLAGASADPTIIDMEQ